MHLHLLIKSISAWWWPEGAGLTTATVYLVTLKAVEFRALKPSRMRLLALCGLLASLYLLYFGMQFPFWLPVVPAVLALFFFGTLTFLPRLISKWQKFHIYATACVALSFVCALWELLRLMQLP